jgi:hypothetical protein
MTETRLVSLVVIAAFACLGLSHFPGAVAAVGSAAVAAFLPLVYLAPASWSGEASTERTTKEAVLLFSGFVVYVLFAAAAPRAATAVVLGTASVYMLIVGRLPWRRSDVGARWVLVAAAGSAIAGILADLPTVIGWHTVTYAAFGASASIALSAAARSARSV